MFAKRVRRADRLDLAREMIAHSDELEARAERQTDEVAAARLEAKSKDRGRPPPVADASNLTVRRPYRWAKRAAVPTPSFTALSGRRPWAKKSPGGPAGPLEFVVTNWHTGDGYLGGITREEMADEAGWLLRGIA